MPRKTLFLFTIIYLAACAFYFFSALAVTEPGYPLDDAWIHQVFARNIATGHGFSFNPDVPISGATAPLWTLLMAALWPLMGPIASSLIMGVLLMWLALIGAYKVAITLTADEKLSGFLLIACTICWPLIYGALSGMEIGLYMTLSLWGLYFYLRADSFTAPINYLSYLLLTLAVLSRPECGLFLAAAIIRDLWEWLHSPRKTLTPWLGRLLVVAIILFPYFAFNYSTTGTIFPQTYTAKSQKRGLLSAAISGDLRYFVKSLTIYPYYYLQDYLRSLAMLCPLLLLGLVSGITKMISRVDRLRSRRVMLVILAILYIPLLGIFAPVTTPTYQNMRLVANILPLFFLFGLAGLFWQVKTRHIRRNFLISGAILGLFGGILILMNGSIATHGARYLIQDMAHFTTNDYVLLTGIVRDTGRNIIVLGAVIVIGFCLGLETMQKAIGRRSIKLALIVIITLFLVIPLILHENYYSNDVAGVNALDKAVGIYLHELGGGEKVAVGDIGAIAYFSGKKILDLKGLVSPELPTKAMMNDSLCFEYMLRYNHVDYAAVYPGWFGYIAKRSDIFKPIKRFEADCSPDTRDNTIIVYRASWPDSNTLSQQEPLGP